jgi:hypothetical protein
MFVELLQPFFGKPAGERLYVPAEEAQGLLRAGGFPHVAAEAADVPHEVFDDWLKRGGSTRKLNSPARRRRWKAKSRPFIGRTMNSNSAFPPSCDY